MRTKKCLPFIMAVLLSTNIIGKKAAPAQQENQTDTSLRDIAGYLAVIGTSIGLGALSGYYDAVHVRFNYDKVAKEVNAISHSRASFEKGWPKIYQGSFQPLQFACGISILQWFSSWYVRRSLVIGVREESQRSWVRRSLGMASFLAAWTAYALMFSLLHKSGVPLNIENFKHWEK